MEIFHLPEDIRTFYVAAQSFPEGIGEAFQNLHQLLPAIHRTFYGISFPDEEGVIGYKAAVAESFDGEAKQYGCETFIIKRGTYLAETLVHWKNDEAIIGATFKNLLKDPRLDLSSYCLEWYRGEDEVMCMVGINP